MKINNYDTELSELLDCPFCGTKPIAYLQGNEYTKKRFITIKCPKCLVQRKVGAISQPTEWLEGKSIQLWNNRVFTKEKCIEALPEKLPYGEDHDKDCMCMKCYKAEFFNQAIQQSCDNIGGIK